VKFALTDQYHELWVQVVKLGEQYSAFHQGSGESSVATFIRSEIKDKSLVLIDEIESSLHPRAQRRMIRYLAELCRLKHLQIVVTTHSPYVLNEFYPEDRICIVHAGGERNVLVGVSPELAMTHMDDEVHTEIDLWVEDEAAKVLLENLIGYGAAPLLRRCNVKPYGSCSVGKSLGTMLHEKRFAKPTIVYLDGDQLQVPGCVLLPGSHAPERVVFSELRTIPEWGRVHARIGRRQSDTQEVLDSAFTLPDHHDWIVQAADHLNVNRHVLWHALVLSWVTECGHKYADDICNTILAALQEKQLFPDPSAKQKPAPVASVADLSLELIAKPVAVKPAFAQRQFPFEDDEEAEREEEEEERPTPAEIRANFAESQADKHYDSL
jgi:energy-coupling factor transporter ATP-binding protein EcfA2